MIRSSFVAIGLIGLFFALNAASEPGPMPREVPDPTTYPPPSGYVCYQAPSAITIDGKLNETAWATIPWSEDFRDIEGDRKPKPRYRTRMKMAWDNKGLYVAAELEEPHVWGTLKNHDAVIFHDNDFEVFLDPDGDGHLYAEMEMNALNTTWDLLLPKAYKDGGPAINAWEVSGLQTAVHVDGTINDARDKDRGWTLEIFWPWNGLKELVANHFPIPPRDGDYWRINFSRVEWDIDIVDGKYVKVPKRPEHNWVWSPQGVIDMHRPERWGVLQFSTAAIGSVKFTGDPAQSARDFLHRVYYTQHDYRKRMHVYANSFERLNLARSITAKTLSKPTLQSTKNSFEAAVDLTLENGVKQTWRIDQQGRFRKD